MHHFVELILNCVAELTLEPHHQMLLDSMINRYQLEFPNNDTPSMARPFILDEQEIEHLLDVAVKYRLESLLTVLASMGTVDIHADQTIKSTPDRWLGRRDPRIEMALINKALKFQHQQITKQTNPSNLGFVDNSSFEDLPPVACPWDPEILLNAQHYGPEIDRYGSREQVVGRRDRNCQQTLVYGLSGNPPTLNHFYFIKHLLQADGVVVTVVLNAQSPLKSSESYVDGTIRFKMLDTMMHDLEDEERSRCCLSRLEIDRAAPSRMVVTMSVLNLLSQNQAQPTLVLGMDALAEFKYWYRWEALGQLCHLKFYPRADQSLSHLVLKQELAYLQAHGFHHLTIVFKTEAERHAFCAFYPEYPPANTAVEFIPNISGGSATTIRQWYRDHALQLPSKLPPHIIKKLNIHPAVHTIIVENDLYRR